jgi:chromosome segregation protein
LHLKKLSLFGFKSFPEVTEVEFGAGMTGIVGPNGCGKTNILDALRWVLGEQRTTAMRSSKMEEVIFNGSRDSKALGMSEVSLTIANSRGALPTEYTDLTITRRLYRSGESEYMMNRQPCRLRDILDLFADTGMGAHSYSVIQQDMIEAVLSDKAEERRFLFDEAAGITKYKHRKRSALRKLDATEADLLRLKDIASEVRTRVNSLKRQSNKARRYAEFKEAWEALHLRLARSDYESLQDRVRTQSTRADNLKSDLEAARARVSATEAGRDAVQTEVEAHEQIVEESRQKLSACEHQLAQLATAREKVGAEGRALATRQTEMSAELELLASRRQDFEHRIRELEADLYSAQSELKRARDEADLHQARRDEAETKWQSAKSAQAQSGELSETALTRRRELESQLVHAETSLVSLCESLTEAEAAHQESLAEAKLAEDDKLKLEGDEAQAKEELSRTEAALRQTRGTLEELQAELASAQDGLAQAQAAQAELESRRLVLASWIESYEGYEGAVPDLLTRDRLAGLHATVAELVAPRSGYEVAVAAALGERAEYLVCSNRDTALQVLKRLESSNVGRATLIILDALDTVAPSGTLPRGYKNLTDLVQVESKYQSLSTFLLSDFYFWTESGDPDLSLIPKTTAVVTREGRIYRGRAQASAGRPKAVGLLSRKDELDKLEQDGKLALESATAARAVTVEVQERLARTTARASELEMVLEQHQERFRDASLEAERGRSRMDTAAAQIQRDESLCRTLRERVDSARGQIARLKEQRVEADGAYQGVQSEHKAMEAAFEDSESARTNAILKSGEAQVHAVSIQGRVDGLTSDLERTREMLADVDNRNQLLLTQISESGQRRNELSAELATRARETETLETDRTQFESAYHKTREGSRDLLTRLQEREKEVKEARKLADEVGGHHHDAEMAASEARLEVSNLCDRIRDAHNVDIANRTELEPIDPAQRGLLTAEVKELRDRLDKMGTVNLLALEEYDEQQARLDFLDQQLADMEEAKKTLLDTIQKINRTARTQFEETFEKVQSNFHALFSQLFEGGEAKVELVDPEDPLESAISVMARPRGKKPVTILQLSGGERALTSIALLFSLYMVKPSPFCILDEIDAPLDDANIGRFLSLLGRFADNTQFIIITHNKMTMQAVDILYGVTMENPGISKVVAVKLNEAMETAETAA